MESLGAAAADWIGVNGDENLKPENVPGVKESGKMEKVEEGAGGGGAWAVDLTVVVKAWLVVQLCREISRQLLDILRRGSLRQGCTLRGMQYQMYELVSKTRSV